MYRSYKEKGAGDIKEETFKQIVIDQLIESRLWVIAARDMGLTVSDADLHDLIIQIPDFQKNGAFDPDLYRRLLAANHWTPSAFEATQQQEILAGKARLIVRDSVALTPWEIAEGQALTPKPQDPTAPTAKDRALQDMLFQKQQRALSAYQEALKAKIPTKIHRELL
jgi:peptidyl-prolyl cis-trans isomerase D